MQRYFVYLGYDGAAYHGWQIQPNGVSVQETLMQALSTLLRKDIQVVGAGRTDAGVHAALMVAHFDSEQVVECSWLVDKLNRILPPDIVIYKVRKVKSDAHARFDATSRTYKYYVATRKELFERSYTARIFGKAPDYEKMNAVAKVLFEYSDFTSFSKLHTDAKTNICRLMQAEWTPLEDGRWVFTIKADRFLRNMVRAIVGTLLDVGTGKLDETGFRRIIEGKDRCMAGSSAPGNALFLVDIEYPETLFQE